MPKNRSFFGLKIIIFEYFSKYVLWVFMNLYMMKRIKKWVKVTVFDFERTF